MTDEEIRSKTRIKRDLKALQDFVRKLIDTADAQLDRLPLSAELVTEIKTARGMKKGARKRQIGFISKRMASEPFEEMQLLLQKMQQPSSHANAVFHRIEGWRDALLRGDEPLFQNLVEELHADERLLRNLIHRANRERQSGTSPIASRQLFRYLRDLSEDIEEPLEQSESGHGGNNS